MEMIISLYLIQAPSVSVPLTCCHWLEKVLNFLVYMVDSSSWVVVKRNMREHK